MVQYIETRFPDYKSDLFAAFINRCHDMCSEFGQIGLLTPYVWMFIQSYEKMRKYIFSTMTMSSIVQLEYNAFEAACVPVATFTLRNYLSNSPFDGIKLSDFKGSDVQAPRTLEAVRDRSCGYRFTARQENFSKIPGEPVAYWVTQSIFDTFNNKNIQEVCTQKTRISTGNNDRFMRKWFEIDRNKMMYPRKWIPCPKGGDYRKWYGNIDLVLNWENNGEELQKFSGAMLGDKNYFFKPGLTWTVISSTKTGFRVVPEGCICDHKGPLIYVKDHKNTLKLLGLLNSRYCEELLKITAPTIGFEWGAIAKTPWIKNSSYDSEIEELVSENINMSKEDWDSFEISWDFKRHPLIRGVEYIGDAFQIWEKECDDRFNKLKNNEGRINELIANMYGIEGIYPDKVSDSDVTIRKADRNREIISLLSYAVGCMFGRYSLDESGIIYAGGEWKEANSSAFMPDKDGIIPICDDEYFEDDIVGKFIDFIRIAFGENRLEDNLQYIAASLGGNKQPRQALRDYFINDFYKDHLRLFQKRPIYWQFDAGRKNSFKCLIYIHRYKPDTVARIRTDYVHEQQSRYRTAIVNLEQRIDGASTGERVKLSKELKHLQEQSIEIHAFEEKIHHLADQFVTIDLDDGVKENYVKFQDILTKIK